MAPFYWGLGFCLIFMGKPFFHCKSSLLKGAVSANSSSSSAQKNQTHLLKCSQTSPERWTGTSLCVSSGDGRTWYCSSGACMHTGITLLFKLDWERQGTLFRQALLFSCTYVSFFCQWVRNESLFFLTCFLEEHVHVLVCLWWCSSRVNVTVIARRAEASLKHHCVSEGKGKCLMLLHLLRMVSILYHLFTAEKRPVWHLVKTAPAAWHFSIMCGWMCNLENGKKWRHIQVKRLHFERKWAWGSMMSRSWFVLWSSALF